MKDKLFGFTQVELTDHELAKYLRSKDKYWTAEKISTGEIGWSRYLAHGKIVAIVKFKNSTPIDRWIFIPITEEKTS